MRQGTGRWIIALTGAIVIVLLFRCFAFTSCLIPSSGMENSLFQGERILVNMELRAQAALHVTLLLPSLDGESDKER